MRIDQIQTAKTATTGEIDPPQPKVGEFCLLAILMCYKDMLEVKQQRSLLLASAQEAGFDQLQDLNEQNGKFIPSIINNSDITEKKYVAHTETGWVYDHGSWHNGTYTWYRWEDVVDMKKLQMAEMQANMIDDKKLAVTNKISLLQQDQSRKAADQEEGTADIGNTIDQTRSLTETYKEIADSVRKGGR